MLVVPSELVDVLPLPLLLHAASSPAPTAKVALMTAMRLVGNTCTPSTISHGGGRDAGRRRRAGGLCEVSGATASATRRWCASPRFRSAGSGPVPRPP